MSYYDKSLNSIKQNLEEKLEEVLSEPLEIVGCMIGQLIRNSSEQVAQVDTYENLYDLSQCFNPFYLRKNSDPFDLAPFAQRLTDLGQKGDWYSSFKKAPVDTKFYYSEIGLNRVLSHFLDMDVSIEDLLDSASSLIITTSSDQILDLESNNYYAGFGSETFKNALEYEAKQNPDVYPDGEDTDAETVYRIMREEYTAEIWEVLESYLETSEGEKDVFDELWCYGGDGIEYAFRHLDERYTTGENPSIDFFRLMYESSGSLEDLKFEALGFVLTKLITLNIANPPELDENSLVFDFNWGQSSILGLENFELEVKYDLTIATPRDAHTPSDVSSNTQELLDVYTQMCEQIHRRLNSVFKRIEIPMDPLFSREYFEPRPPTARVGSKMEYAVDLRVSYCTFAENYESSAVDLDFSKDPNLSFFLNRATDFTTTQLCVIVNTKHHKDEQAFARLHIPKGVSEILIFTPLSIDLQIQTEDPTSTASIIPGHLNNKTTYPPIMSAAIAPSAEYEAQKQFNLQSVREAFSRVTTPVTQVPLWDDESAWSDLKSDNLTSISSNSNVRLLEVGVKKNVPHYSTMYFVESSGVEGTVKVLNLTKEKSLLNGFVGVNSLFEGAKGYAKFLRNEDLERLLDGQIDDDPNIKSLSKHTQALYFVFPKTLPTLKDRLILNLGDWCGQVALPGGMKAQIVYNPNNPHHQNPARNRDSLPDTNYLLGNIPFDLRFVQEDSFDGYAPQQMKFAPTDFRRTISSELSQEEILEDLANQAVTINSNFSITTQKARKISETKLIFDIDVNKAAFLKLLGVSKISFVWELLSDLEIAPDPRIERYQDVSGTEQISIECSIGKNVNLLASSHLALILPQMLYRFEEHSQPNKAINESPLGVAIDTFSQEQVASPYKFIEIVASKVLTNAQYFNVGGIQTEVQEAFNPTATGYLGAARYLYSFIDFYTKPLSILHNVVLNPNQYGVARSNPYLKRKDSQASTISIKPTTSWLKVYCEALKQSQPSCEEWSLLLDMHTSKQSPTLKDVEFELDLWSANATVKEFNDLFRQTKKESTAKFESVLREFINSNTYQDISDKLPLGLRSSDLASEVRDVLDPIRTPMRLTYTHFTASQGLLEDPSPSRIIDQFGVSDYDTFSKQLNTCIEAFARFWTFSIATFYTESFRASAFFQTMLEGTGNITHVANLSHLFERGTLDAGLQKIKKNKSVNLADGETAKFTVANLNKNIIPYIPISYALKLFTATKQSFGALPGEVANANTAKERLPLGAYISILSLIAAARQIVALNNLDLEEFGPTIWMGKPLGKQAILLQQNGFIQQGSSVLRPPNQSVKDDNVLASRFGRVTSTFALCIGQPQQGYLGVCQRNQGDIFSFFSVDRYLFACIHMRNGVLYEIKAGGNAVIGATEDTRVELGRYGSSIPRPNIADSIDFRNLQITLNFLAYLITQPWRGGGNYSLANCSDLNVIAFVVSAVESILEEESIDKRDYLPSSFVDLFNEALSKILSESLSREVTISEISDKMIANCTEIPANSVNEILPSPIFSEVKRIFVENPNFTSVENLIPQIKRPRGLKWVDYSTFYAGATQSEILRVKENVTFDLMSLLNLPAFSQEQQALNDAQELLGEDNLNTYGMIP